MNVIVFEDPYPQSGRSVQEFIDNMLHNKCCREREKEREK